MPEALKCSYFILLNYKYFLTAFISSDVFFASEFRFFKFPNMFSSWNLQMISNLIPSQSKTSHFNVILFKIILFTLFF